MIFSLHQPYKNIKDISRIHFVEKKRKEKNEEAVKLREKAIRLYVSL